VFDFQTNHLFFGDNFTVKPYGARSILHEWNKISRAKMYRFISKFAIIPLKKQVAKNSIALVRCILSFLSSLSEIFIIVFMPPVGRRTCVVESYDCLLNRRRTVPVEDLWNIYVDAICTSANTRCCLPVADRLINHRPVPSLASCGARTGIFRFVKRF